MDSNNKEVDVKPVSDIEKPISLVSKPSHSQKSSGTAAGATAAKSARSKSLQSAKSSEK